MSAGKEIRTKIRSIQNTRKITNAMEMVAASKMRRAQQRMEQARPYADKIRQVIRHLSNANPEYRHTYMEAREVKRVGYLVVSSDRGLCGGLNGNLFRQLLRSMKAEEQAGVGVEVATIGTKAGQFFGRWGGTVVADVSQIGDRPELQDLAGPIQVMLGRFENGDIDELRVCYNVFVNAMTQRPTEETLLPLPQQEMEENSSDHGWDYVYEPTAPEVLDQLLRRYLESVIYQSVVENIASEQAARMVAMKAASDNADKLIDELQLAYNKARQAAITKELSEIVSGAAAV